MTITTLVGNPTPGSRTMNVAKAVAVRIATRTGIGLGRSIDLAEHSKHLFEWEHVELAKLQVDVAASRILVVASPTYKATYTGLLKAFLDRFGKDGLMGVIAVPVMTIGSETHAMAVEAYLRPLLVELGASVPTRGLAFPVREYENRESLVESWATGALPALFGLSGDLRADPERTGDLNR